MQALSQPVEDIGLGYAEAAAPTSTPDLPWLSLAEHVVLSDNKDSSPLPDSPVDSCAERYTHI